MIVLFSVWYTHTCTKYSLNWWQSFPLIEFYYFWSRIIKLITLNRRLKCFFLFRCIESSFQRNKSEFGVFSFLRYCLHWVILENCLISFCIQIFASLTESKSFENREVSLKTKYLHIILTFIWIVFYCKLFRSKQANISSKTHIYLCCCCRCCCWCRSCYFDVSSNFIYFSLYYSKSQKIVENLVCEKDEMCQCSIK